MRLFRARFLRPSSVCQMPIKKRQAKKVRLPRKISNMQLRNESRRFFAGEEITFARMRLLLIAQERSGILPHEFCEIALQEVVDGVEHFLEHFAVDFDVLPI